MDNITPADWESLTRQVNSLTESLNLTIIGAQAATEGLGFAIDIIRDLEKRVSNLETRNSPIAGPTWQ